MWLVGGIYGYGYNVLVWLVGVVRRYIDICTNGLLWGSERISKTRRERLDSLGMVKLYHTVRHEYNTEHAYIN